MSIKDVTEVCRICPRNDVLIDVFDKRILQWNNIREVILVTTGIEILEDDFISKKICLSCCDNAVKLFQFRQDALKQNRTLKEKCSQYLKRGLRLPNTSVIIKKEMANKSSLVLPKLEAEDPQPSTSRNTVKKQFFMHPSVKDVYKNNPTLKLPKKCFGSHITPVVSLTMGDVESYFRTRKLEMRKYIYSSTTRHQTPNRVAKKKTTNLPTKMKTVAPLKISKKFHGNTSKMESPADNNYVCSSISKEKKKRKRSRSSSKDINKGSKRKKHRESNKRTPLIVKPLIEPVREKIRGGCFRLSNVFASDNSIVSTHASVSDNVHASDKGFTSDNAITFGKSSFSKNALFSNNSKKAEFIESLGLMPTVSTTKSQALHICTLCASVHTNAFELKRHSRKHMVCQFCKLRFKSLESKEDHVENLCEVKNITNSLKPIVMLDKIDLNLKIRQKYQNAFNDFKLIPGLIEPTPAEEIIWIDQSPLPSDEVIEILSDDEEPRQNIIDPPLPTASAVIQNLLEEKFIYSRSDVTIKNDTTLDNTPNTGRDLDVIKALLKVVKHKQPTVVENAIQTDLPTNSNININKSTGICELKNLKEQLKVYKVPLTIRNGPYSVMYRFKDNKVKNNMELWNDLPVIDVYKTTNQGMTQNSSMTPNTVVNVNPQINGIVHPSQFTLSSVQLNPGYISNTLGTLSSPSATVTASAVIQKQTNSIPIQASDLSSTATVLQNYALGITTNPIGSDEWSAYHTSRPLSILRSIPPIYSTSAIKMAANKTYASIVTKSVASTTSIVFSYAATPAITPCNSTAATSPIILNKVIASNSKSRYSLRPSYNITHATSSTITSPVIHSTVLAPTRRQPLPKGLKK